MATYIFLCNKNTQEECLSKNLFGGGADYVFKAPVKKNDRLFLYNYDTHSLLGEFVAMSDGGNFDPNAWGKRFPWQVRVMRVKEFAPLHRSDIESILKFKIYPPARIKDDQLEKLREKFVSSKRVSQEEIDYRLQNPPMLRTRDGHFVRSEAERTIDDWFDKNKIFHQYEFEIAVGFTDFLVPRRTKGDLYIEYWGLNTDKYKKKQKEKVAWYKSQDFALLELRDKDLKHLDKILGECIEP